MSLATAEIRLDDATVGAFTKELEYIEARVIEKKYPQYKAAEGLLFQIEEVAMPWVESTTFRMMDAVGGDFELSDDQTTNLSFVDVLSEEFSQRTFTFRKGYYFTEKEVARTLHLGMPIEEQKISVVRRSYMQTLNKLLLFGHRKTGQPGFINNPAWLRSYAPYPLNSSSTVAQQLATLNAGPNGITAATRSTEEADTLLLPRTTYDYLLSQSRLDNTLERTTLRFFLENNPSIRNIDWLNELSGAGPNGEDVAIFYSRNPDTFKARITDPFRYRAPIVEPFRVVRPVAFDYNGIIPYIPYSVHVMIGV
ncbi:MAG TPA: major capsid family protein [Coleofasciculaceae cyanobacterium]